MSGKILEKAEVAPNIHRLVLKAPRIAKKARPGQFIMIVPDEVGERIPFTLSDWDAEAGTITVFFLEAGVSTMKLAKMRIGESVHVLVGPLGRPTEIEKVGTVLIGGGCYGLGAMYPLARSFKEQGNKVIGAIEARTEYVIYNEKELREVCDELIVTTSDGSKGIKGHVRDVVDQLIKKGERIDHAHFLGCTFMMMQSSKATSPHKIPTIVSLNALMVDGTGMCGCCRVNVGGETKFACVDGPDFDGHQVDWDMVASRAGAYVPDENLAYQFYHIKEDGAMKKNQGHEEEVA